MLLCILLVKQCVCTIPRSFRLLGFQYGFQFPMADMQDRFGSNTALNLNIEHVHMEPNWFVGIEGSYLFGNTVKEDVLAGLRSFDGSIIGIDGMPGDVYLKQRGFYAGLYTGKIFSTAGDKNPLTGIRAVMGGGLLQHQIRVQDNFTSVVALEPDYQQGYDRLTNGFCARLGIGYQSRNLSNNFHFRIMGDVFAGFTASRRDFDYAAGRKLDDSRLDLLAGLSATYMVFISRSRSPEEIYY